MKFIGGGSEAAGLSEFQVHETETGGGGSRVVRHGAKVQQDE